MLTVLFNRWNATGDRLCQEIADCRLEGIGICAELPLKLRAQLAQAAPVLLYDACLAIDDPKLDGRLDAALRDAMSLSARAVLFGVGGSCDPGSDDRDFAETVRQMARRCEQGGLAMLLTNRRPFKKGAFVCAEKLKRLCGACGAKLALDVGASHACNRALEDFFDLYECAQMLMLNDNFGRDACYPVGHPDFDPSILPDDMRQPGYGTVPYVKIGENLRALAPDRTLMINGRRHQGAPLKQVMLETRVLLSGRVFVNPAGGRIGMNPNGRMLL